MTKSRRNYNSQYSGEYLNHVAFPLGGIGAGMVCLEGTAALSHLSLRNSPEVFNEPTAFSALCIKGEQNTARVLEGPVPGRKVFGLPGTGNGASGKTYGLPRFTSATFTARFPFATVELADQGMPLDVQVTGWSPFIPGDADNSSLPVAALEYRFANRTERRVEAVYSFNARNFMATGAGGQAVLPTGGGFVLSQPAVEGKPWAQGAFSATVTSAQATVNYAWFRGGWFDSLTMAWRDIVSGECIARPPITEGEPSPGASIFVPLELDPGAVEVVRLMLCWYVPKTQLCHGPAPAEEAAETTHVPWYAGRFRDIFYVTEYFTEHYEALRRESARFSDCFYDTTLPPEVVEAVAANLTILKSPTVLRQQDGRLWCWEGCRDNAGCCAGSCTHVWNYAQALPHLFASLERTLRETEFGESQDEAGHQTFRAALPIRPTGHGFHAASDGQLGGVMKMYREWRISGDTEWLRGLWPKVQASLDYCIRTWDPNGIGVLAEPHHNTYDIEFWGPDGMCSSFYLGALSAACVMGRELDEDVSRYEELLAKGVEYLEKELFNGEYFVQKVQWKGLRAGDPATLSRGAYSPEALALLEKEGPKYQYGTGCLSDGVLGAWLAEVSGVPPFLDADKVKSHVRSVHRYNLRSDLSDHANPQRPSFAVGNEGGLLLCSWPHGGEPSLPFVYSNEVWTGIEYQVASHLMACGMVDEGLEVVRTCHDRYDGRIRNPFNEYECGHWYARAMASYALLQGLTGVRYDALTRTLYVQPSLQGDFRSFLSTATGYGTVIIRDGKVWLEVCGGHIDVDGISYTPAQ